MCNNYFEFDMLMFLEDYYYLPYRGRSRVSIQETAHAR